ncbi:MAG: AAA family ATPase [Pseudomonadota bacterium]
MATIHLLEGPVGAGKSTYAAQLSHAHRAPHLNLDEWLVTLFRPDRPEADFMAWYLERKDRCLAQIWATAGALLDLEIDVVLELGLVQAAARQAFYERADAEDRALIVYLLETPKAERWARVQCRNVSGQGRYHMPVDEAMFELANNAWEPPSSAERRARAIREIS